MLYIPGFLKRCSKGRKCLHPEGPQLLATQAYFHRNSSAKDGLNCACKECAKAALKEQHRKHRRRDTEYSKAWRQANPAKVRARKKREYEKHHEKIRAKVKKWREQNPQKANANIKAWHKRHPGKRREIGRTYVKRHPDKINANTIKYRTKKRGLPCDFGIQEWQHALNYFNGCCAVCGRPPGLWHTLARDHWIPITSPDCPGTIPANIVPLCHSLKDGENGCNNSKNNRDPVEWLTAKYGKRKAAQILKRIETYFEWVREQDKQYHI